MGAQNREVLEDNSTMSTDLKKVEKAKCAIDKKAKSRKEKNTALKSNIQELEMQNPDSQLKVANEDLKSQLESRDLQIRDLAQASKDAEAHHASNAAALKAENASLKALLTGARQQSELNDLRSQNSKLVHELGKARQKVAAADAFLKLASDWREKFVGQRRG